jgi:hypothetical protein
MSFAQAQSQTTEKSSHYMAAEEYMLALNMEQTISEGIDDMVEMQTKNNPVLASKKDVFKKFMQKHMSWNVVREDYLKIYMAEFTEAEFKDMTAFYRTPTGKKVAAKQNVLTIKTAQLGQDKMEANMAELMQVMQ